VLTLSKSLERGESSTPTLMSAIVMVRRVAPVVWMFARIEPGLSRVPHSGVARMS
jgi:hypothetical protein